MTESELPKTKKERKLCFTPKHICKAIAGWHGVKGKGPPTKNPAKAGQDGLGHRGQPEQEGRLLVHRREAGRHATPRRSPSTPRTARRRSTSCARSTPGCTARSKSSPGARARRPIHPRAPAWGAGRSSAPWAAARSLVRCPGWARPGAPVPLLGAGRHAAGRGAVRSGPALPIPRELRGARIEIPMREAEVQVLPGAEDEDVDLRRDLSGADDPAPRRPADRGHLRPPSCRAEAGELTVHLHGGHNRTQFDGQPGGLTQLASAAPSTAGSRRGCRRGSRATTC